MHRDLLARSLSLSMLVLLIVAGCSEEIGPSTDDRPLLGGAEDPIERPRKDAAVDLPFPRAMVSVGSSLTSVPS